MENNKIGFWKYFFKSDGVYVLCFTAVITLLIIIQQLYDGTGEWYYGFGFLFVGAIVVPFVTWLEYLKKNK